MDLAAATMDSGGCYRALSDVLWGFVVTLLALVVSAWGSLTYVYERGPFRRAVLSIALGVWDPLFDLDIVVTKSLRCVSLLWNCHKVESPNARMTSRSWLKFLCSTMFPWAKCPARILAACDIVVYVSKESPLLEDEWLWAEEEDMWAGQLDLTGVKDESEALVVGENGTRAYRHGQYERRMLGSHGKGVLLWAEVFCTGNDLKFLPKYDELKYLRGRSEFGVIAIAVQAMGYTYAVLFRNVMDLRISPIEVIGLVLNIILLIKSCLYFTCNPCQRPLVIYMKEDWERQFLDMLVRVDRRQFTSHPHRISKFVITSTIVGCLNILLVCTFVSLIEPTDTVVKGLLTSFLLGIFSCFIGHTLVSMKVVWGGIFLWAGCHITSTVFNRAVTTTVSKWSGMQYDGRAELVNLSQLIPFIV